MTRMTGPFQLEAREVKEQKRVAQSLSLGPGELQDPLEGLASLKGPVGVELVWTLEQDEFAVSGRASGEWDIECVRCLQPKRLGFRAPFEGRFPSSLGTLDAGEEVRQALVLAVPMRALCRPDCQGLCARCGANRNAGPCACAGAS